MTREVLCARLLRQFLLFDLGATPGDVKGLLLALCSGISPNSVQESNSVLVIEQDPTVSEASVLTPVLSITRLYIPKTARYLCLS